MNNINPALLLAAVVAGWLLQMFLSYRQGRSFRNDTALMRPYGQITVGSGGSRYRGGRAFVALAVDASGYVRAASVLRGWTTFARSQPLDEAVGKSLKRLAAPSPIGDFDAPVRDACRQAAELLITARRSGATPPNTEEVTKATS